MVPVRSVSATLHSVRPGACVSPAGPFGDLQAFEHGQATCLCPFVSLVPMEMAPKEMGSILWAFCGLAQPGPKII